MVSEGFYVFYKIVVYLKAEVPNVASSGLPNSGSHAGIALLLERRDVFSQPPAWSALEHLKSTTL